MESTSPGELVKVAGGGPVLDGIVFDLPSRTKVVVAVVDQVRGPLLRTVHPSTLSEREADGPQDVALRLLIKRTPRPARGASRGGESSGRGRAGHSGPSMHRPTGK